MRFIKSLAACIVFILGILSAILAIVYYYAGDVDAYKFEVLCSLLMINMAFIVFLSIKKK